MKSLRITILDFDDIKNPLLGAGQARSTMEVGKRLVKIGHHVTVISSRYPESQDRFENGIHYIHIGAGTSNIKFNNLIYILVIPFYVPKIQADVIIECFTAPISTLFSPLFTRIPVVALPSMFNAKEFSRKYHLPFEWIEKIGVRFYKYMMPYSRTDAAKIRKLNPKVKLKIVGQGVSEEFLKIKQKKPKYILFYGRLDIWQKGIDILLKTFGKVTDKLLYPLVIAGHGPDEKKVIQLIKENGLRKKVRLIGPIYDKKKANVFSRALYVVFPSRHDEICLGTLEVLASGLPLVAFDLPESKWLTKEVALKSKTFDTDLFGKSMIHLANPRINQKMKKNTREFVKQYTWEKVVSKYNDFITDVVNNENINLNI